MAVGGGGVSLRGSYHSTVAAAVVAVAVAAVVVAALVTAESLTGRESLVTDGALMHLATAGGDGGGGGGGGGGGVVCGGDGGFGGGLAVAGLVAAECLVRGKGFVADRTGMRGLHRRRKIRG